MTEHTDKPRVKPGKGHHPNSLANLRPFQNGNHANPKGRPVKDCSLTSLLKLELDKHPVVNGVKSDMTWRELLVQSWLRTSMKNPVLFKEILDRVEGKVMQPVAGEDGGAIPVRIEYVSDSRKPDS